MEILNKLNKLLEENIGTEVLSEITPIFKEVIIDDIDDTKVQVKKEVNQKYLIDKNEIIKIIEKILDIIENKLNFDDNKYMNALQQGYLLVMLVREFITGKPLNYRFYVTYKDDNDIYSATVVEFNEDVLIQNMKASLDGEIKLVESGLSSLNKQQAYQKMLDRHFDNIMKCFIQAEWTDKTYYRVTWNTLKDLTGIITREQKIGRNGNYNITITKKVMQQKSMYPNLFQKSNNRYQSFNMGHITEGYDITTSYFLLKNRPNVEFKTFRNQFFTPGFLERDNIKAAAGGDNKYTNTSIKSKNANALMKVPQLLESLNNLKIIFNSIDNKEIAEIINKTFLSLEKEKNIDKISEELAKKLKNNLFKN